MQKDKLDEILEECLWCVENGGGIEDCLAQFPEAAGKLRPLLLTAKTVKAVPAPRTSLAAKELGLERMLASVSFSAAKKDSAIRRVGEITMKIAFRFALVLAVGVIGLVWFISFWQQQEGAVNEAPEILPTATAIETPTITETPTPEAVHTVKAPLLPTNIPTAVFTETPVRLVAPTIVSTMPPVSSPTNQPISNETLLLPPPTELNNNTTLTIIPANPTTTDRVEIFVQGTAACPIVPIYQSYQINENVIQIEARKPDSNICAGVMTDWDFSLNLDPLLVGSYRVEIFVSQGEIRELWGREFLTIVLSPTAIPTLTCDEQVQADGQYIIRLDASLFTDGVTENGETLNQVAERLATKYESVIMFVYESISGFSVKYLSSEGVAALLAEPEVEAVTPDMCAEGG